MNLQTFQFIQTHLHDDVIQLRLQEKRYPEVDMDLAIRQIQGKQKIRSKVNLFYHQEGIRYPRPLSIEQSSSEITAKYKSTLFSGNTFADFTGGFGVDFYFISKNFKAGIFVEQDEALCKLAEHNFKVLNIPAYEIHHAKSEDFLKNMPEVNLIYIDPHRRSQHGKKNVLISDCEPDVSIIANKLLHKSPVVLVKLSPMLDLHQAISVLPQAVEIHIIAVGNECKETLFILHRNKLGKNPENEKSKIEIKTRNLHKTKSDQMFDFTLEEEKIADPEYTDNPGRYIYESNAAILKSGAFKLIATRYNLKKFHVNTHLYTGDVLIRNFPGRIMQVTDVFGNHKADFKKMKMKYMKANVSVRNYPISVTDFRKKTGIKDGGDIYLFAFKTSSDKNMIISCNKIK